MDNTNSNPVALATALAVGTKLDLTRRSRFTNKSAADRDSVKVISHIERHGNVLGIRFRGVRSGFRAVIREGGEVGLLTGDRIRYTVNGIAS